MALAIRETLSVFPRRAVRQALSAVRSAVPWPRKGPGALVRDFFVQWQAMLEDGMNLIVPKFEE